MVHQNSDVFYFILFYFILFYFIFSFFYSIQTSRRRPIKGTLFVTGDGLRVVDDETKVSHWINILIICLFMVFIFAFVFI